MKKLTFLLMTLLVSIGLLSAHDTQAQGGGSTDPQDTVSFRPLGRFTIAADNLTISPNGFYVAGTTSSTSPSTGQNMAVAGDDITIEELLAELEAMGISDEDISDEELMALMEAMNMGDGSVLALVGGTQLSMWDIRGGDLLWTVDLPENRTLEAIVFAPSSDILYVLTNRPYPAEEEVRLSFYDTVTGELISRTGDIDVIQTAIIPGDLPQELYIEPQFTPDGQRMIINYQRRLEDMRCAAWDLATGTIIWQARMHCGSVNGDGRFLIVAQPHDNPYSSYPQLAVYDVEAGEVVAASEDEVVEARWIDNAHVMIHRPYGDPPVIWDVVSNTRAILETPFKSIRFWVLVLPGGILTHAQHDSTFVWDQSSGRLLREVPARGSFLIQEDRILLIQTDSNWYELEGDERNNAFRAYDFETGNQVWGTRWQHELWDVSVDGSVAVAFDQVNYTLDVFDLNTGEQLGSLQISGSGMYLTQDWQWLVESNFGSFVVWGSADQVSRFADPPGAVSRGDTDVYYDPNTNYNPATQLLENTYVWPVERTSNNEWLLAETSSGYRYWIPAGALDVLTDLEALPVRE